MSTEYNKLKETLLIACFFKCQKIKITAATDFKAHYKICSLFGGFCVQKTPCEVKRLILVVMPDNKALLYLLRHK